MIWVTVHGKMFGSKPVKMRLFDWACGQGWKAEDCYGNAHDLGCRFTGKAWWGKVAVSNIDIDFCKRALKEERDIIVSCCMRPI